MEVLITMIVVSVILVIVLASEQPLSASPTGGPPKRQPWASRSPEKLSEDEQAILSTGRARHHPNHAMDGITRGREGRAGIQTRAPWQPSG